MSREAFVLPKYVGTNISFDREPRNAIEYLMSVRKEAETIPDFMNINIPVQNDKVKSWIERGGWTWCSWRTSNPRKGGIYSVMFV